MIIHDVEQGSEEWLRMHLGIPTASRFGKIVTPKTRKPSTQAFGLICELVAEWMLGEGVNVPMTQHMQRGLVLEGEAVNRYEFDHNVEAQRVGFVTDDDESVGCSPDALIGDDGGLEIKCPGAVKHIEYLLEPDRLRAAYFAQVQGSLWICGRQWWDLMSWHPNLPPVRLRIVPDDEYIEALAEGVNRINERVKEVLQQFGYVATSTDAA